MQIINPQSIEDLNAYYQLRWEILRKPLGFEEGSEKDDLEDISVHRAIKKDNKLIAVGRLHFIDDKTSQIRYMGVEEGFQKKGLGKLMVDEFEKVSIQRNILKIILYSRESAVKFYEKSGFTTIEKAHRLKGVQHFLMEKKINTL